ncbi:hypothetical protein ASE92_06265 [Pedobacter sp. Leaf41]|nr:hypothetical protein ASE92_06265 [Pedobacter sp. Leaf41]
MLSSEAQKNREILLSDDKDFSASLEMTDLPNTITKCLERQVGETPNPKLQTLNFFPILKPLRF